MKKVLLSFVMLTVGMTVSAQDVIVKKDGSTILSKVIKIGTSEVEYKKFSNQNGPTYSILKSDIQAINYENGEKEIFMDSQTTNNSSAMSSNNTAFEVNPNLAEDNLKLVQEFNSHSPVYSSNDTHKKASTYTYVLGLKEGSIIETPELKASFAMKIWYGKVTQFGHTVVDERTLNLDEPRPYTNCNYQYRIAVILKNKTNKAIYIDLANSFILQNDQARPYYVPTATTTMQGGSSGGSVNLGAVAGAVGVGGTLGSLANGVNVGGSNISSNTKTTYSQRIVAVPPMSSIALDPMDIGQGFIWVTARKPAIQASIELAYKSYFKDKGFKEVEYFGGIKACVPKELKRGEVIDIPPLDDVNPLGAFITYSFDEIMNSTQTMRMDFYLRQILGTKSGIKDIDISQCPLVFF